MEGTNNNQGAPRGVVLESCIKCNHCGVFEPVPIPTTTGRLHQLVDKFQRVHKDCEVKYAK